MTGKLVLENLKHRPMRSLLSILLIGVPVTLILTLVGLSHGFLEDAQRRARGIGADVIIRPKNTSLLSALGAPMPEQLVEFFQTKVPHVRLAMGVVNQPVQSVFLGATGVDLAKFNQMSGGINYIKGGPFRGPNDAIIDQFYAAEKNLHVGDSLTFLNSPWPISGIMEGGQLARIIVPLAALQDKTANNGKVSQIYLKLDKPANTAAVIEGLKKILPDYPIYPMEELASLYTANNIPGLNAFVYVIIAIGVVIGFAVVCLSMYMAVLQRTREIGILKALGASKTFILGTILAEALLLGVGGTVLGIIMSFGAYWLIATLVPASIQMVIVPAWWPIAGLITLFGATLGALYPGLSAAAHDPIEALAYE